MFCPKILEQQTHEALSLQEGRVEPHLRASRVRLEFGRQAGGYLKCCKDVVATGPAFGTNFDMDRASDIRNFKRPMPSLNLDFVIGICYLIISG